MARRLGEAQDREDEKDIADIEVDEAKLQDDNTPISYRQNLIVQMAAAGLPTRHISKQVRMGEKYVAALINQHGMRKRITQAQERFWGRGLRKRMEFMAHKALDQIESLMNDPEVKCSTRLSASTYIVDQAVGRAQQTVAVATTSLGEIMERIDKLSTRDVAPLNALEAPKDALDTCVDEMIPDAIGVGVKEYIVEEAKVGSVSDGVIEACSEGLTSDTEV